MSEHDSSRRPDDSLTDRRSFLARAGGLTSATLAGVGRSTHRWWPAKFGRSERDPTTRYIGNGRDLGEWLHRDFTYQGLLAATLILLSFGAAALDAGNPYLASGIEGAFVTFGGLSLLPYTGGDLTVGDELEQARGQHRHGP